MCARLSVAGSHHYVEAVAVQPASAKAMAVQTLFSLTVWKLWLSSRHPPKAHGFPATIHPKLCKTQLCENCGCPATAHPKLMAFQPPLTQNTNWSSSAVFILFLRLLLPSLDPKFLSIPDGKQIEIYWAPWMEASMQGCFWHSHLQWPRSKTWSFPLHLPSILWGQGIYTVRGNVQTSGASGQWKTCMCLASCYLWLASCSGQAGLHICQQISARPQHSTQMAFCHKSHRLPPCICTMHVCVCLSHLVPAWLLTLLPLEQISWFFDLWHALGMGSHLWRCQTHWALAACSLIESQGVGTQLLSSCWAPPRLSPCPCPCRSQELQGNCHKYVKPPPSLPGEASLASLSRNSLLATNRKIIFFIFIPWHFQPPPSRQKQNS